MHEWYWMLLDAVGLLQLLSLVHVVMCNVLFKLLKFVVKKGFGFLS